MSTEEHEVKPTEQQESAEVQQTEQAATATETADAAESPEDVENLKKQMEEWEADSKKLEELLNKDENKSEADVAAAATAEVDSRSIYVGNVDYSTTEEEFTEMFSACGKVVRVTIPKDKFTGSPKGFAYVEFENAEDVVSAILLSEREFKGRPLKITSKRTNVPWFKQPGARGGRGGRGGAGRGRGRGGFMPMPGYGYAPVPMAYPMYYMPRGGARGGRGASRGSRGRHQPY
jgi:polyadenylate-binding protein 2